MKKKFKKVLVANRGEIAVRIMRTCRELGVSTVAVYSDADRGAAHVLRADEAAPLGDPEPGRSYLDAGKIIEAAVQRGADAVHPGYGFLAENAAFAERCTAEGLVFIGPPPEAIRTMGDKVLARKLAADAGVPVIPGTLETSGDKETAAREAGGIGFPLIVKARLGGGGKGMRVVRTAAALEEALAQAGAEARKAFGDGSIYLEKYFTAPHHVEFQVLADGRGSLVHMGERECSVQRRYQKIIEESPSPLVDDDLRRRMSEAALSVARAAGYVGAGTVEFLVGEDRSFYFMEMNTRIQVEHTVTEMRTGIDLVRKQIEIAQGEALGLSQDDIRPSGHALECRVYAEDPQNGFLPSPGLVILVEEPGGIGVRVDGGIRAGAEVPVEYDPILSKVITHGRTREEAVERMKRALEEYAILGVRTTIPFMIDVLESRAFMEGGIHTGFIDEHFQEWRPDREYEDLAAVAYVMHDREAGRLEQAPGAVKAARKTPWRTLGRWRL